MIEQPKPATLTSAAQPQGVSEGSKTRCSLTEQSVQDFSTYFSEQKGLTYLLCAKDDDGADIYGAKPDPITALRLIPASLDWQEFDSTLKPENVDRTALAIGVQRRVQEMIRRGRQFAIFWHIAGDRTVSFQSSSQYGFVTLEHELIDAVVNDLTGYLYGIA